MGILEAQLKTELTIREIVEDLSQTTDDTVNTVLLRLAQVLFQEKDAIKQQLANYHASYYDDVIHIAASALSYCGSHPDDPEDRWDTVKLPFGQRSKGTFSEKKLTDITVPKAAIIPALTNASIPIPSNWMIGIQGASEKPTVTDSATVSSPGKPIAISNTDYTDSDESSPSDYAQPVDESKYPIAKLMKELSPLKDVLLKAQARRNRPTKELVRDAVELIINAAEQRCIEFSRDCLPCRKEDFHSFLAETRFKFVVQGRGVNSLWQAIRSNGNLQKGLCGFSSKQDSTYWSRIFPETKNDNSL